MRDAVTVRALDGEAHGVIGGDHAEVCLLLVAVDGGQVAEEIEALAPVTPGRGQTVSRHWGRRGGGLGGHRGHRQEDDQGDHGGDSGLLEPGLMTWSPS